MKNKKKYYIVGGLFVSVVTIYTIYNIMEGVAASDHKNKTHYSSRISGTTIDSSDGAVNSSEFHDKKIFILRVSLLRQKLKRKKNSINWQLRE